MAEFNVKEKNYPRNRRESPAMQKNPGPVSRKRSEAQFPDKARRLVHLLLQAGASDCLFVGGFVRDHFLGLRSKDIDIEVYGLSYEKMLAILRPHFRVSLVGKSFGTIKVGGNIDLSIPRLEAKTGQGHRGFDVSSNPELDPQTAFSRRDFTINAIGLRLDGTVFDPFDGLGDLERKILRAPTEAFCEDPLRVLRAMQFAARFGFDMEPRTVELCRRVLPEFKTLSEERVGTEWRKWACKGRRPGKGLLLLQATGWLECFPELAAMAGVPQNPEYHPEGDVLTHTVMVCDAAAKIADEANLAENEREVLLFAALCHDFGKAVTTVRNEKGNWSSPRHAAESTRLATSFLQRLRLPNHLLERVVPLVREHAVHRSPLPESKSGEAVVRRLACRLAPSSLWHWALLCRADLNGRGYGHANDHFSNNIEIWESVATRLGVRDAKPTPILQGRDLLERGISPGPELGDMLKTAFEAQLDGDFDSRDAGLAWLDTMGIN